MRPIYLARMDKTHPVLVLSRGGRTIGLARSVTVAGITSTAHGLDTELQVGPANGLDKDSVVNLDDVQTILQRDLGAHVGYLRSDQEPALLRAVAAAFELDPDD